MGGQTARFGPFLGVAVAAGALDGTYGRLVLGALVLCWLGDVLLIPKSSDAAFKGGLVSFLLGHVVLVVAFAWRGLDPTGLAAAALLSAVAVVLALRWLRPHVPDSFRVPVHAYVAVISLMVVAAAGATAAGVAVVVGAALLRLGSGGGARAVRREEFPQPGLGPPALLRRHADSGLDRRGRVMRRPPRTAAAAAGG